jgi:uncharacterized membrane protein
MTCANCHAEIPAGVAFCPQCGAAVGAAAGAPVVTPVPVSTVGTTLAPNVAGALAYVTIIPAIVFLVIEPFNKDKFVRFHSFQCLFLTVAIIALEILLGIVGGVLGFGLGFGLVWVLYRLFSLLVLIVVILCAVKAYQGKKLLLPVIGKISEQMADKVS